MFNKVTFHGKTYESLETLEVEVDSRAWYFRHGDYRVNTPGKAVIQVLAQDLPSLVEYIEEEEDTFNECLKEEDEAKKRLETDKHLSLEARRRAQSRVTPAATRFLQRVGREVKPLRSLKVKRSFGILATEENLRQAAMKQNQDLAEAFKEFLSSFTQQTQKSAK